MEYNIENILANIFKKDDDSKQINLKEKMDLITKEINTYKGDIKNYVSNTEYNLQELEKECEELCEESEKLIEVLSQRKSEIEDNTLKETKRCLTSDRDIRFKYQRMEYSMSVIHDIMLCGKYYVTFKENRRLGRFSAAADNMVSLHRYLDQPMEDFSVLSISHSLEKLAEKHRKSFIEFLLQKLSEHFSWKTEEINRQHNVTINLNLPNAPETIDFLQALGKLGQFQPKMEEFSLFLYRHVLEPIVLSDCTVVPDDVQLLVIVPIASKKTPTYDVVIANTRTVIEFISDKLYPLHHGAHTVMDLVGKCVGPTFVRMVVNKCFIQTIPDSMEELANYHLITTDIEEFQYFLMQARFMNSDLSLLNYTDNLETLFADKCCENLLVKARNIMSKDLSSSMSIGVEWIPTTESDGLLDEGTEKMLEILDKSMPSSLFYFPRCMISKSAQELLDMVNLVMEQAVECSDLLLKNLYTTCRLVFELYDAVMPYKHVFYLDNIPQYVALFHNNCMYLAHNLQNLGEKWTCMMGERRVDFPISFADLVWKLRNLAYTHLAKMMQVQRSQILDNIRSSDLNSIVVKEVLGDNAEQAVRQCVRQLQILKNVWIGVFPLNVFTRLMGTLVNLFVEELIHRVCTVEDISVEMTTQLVDIYTIVVKKVHLLFQGQDDHERHVKSWSKFQELILILGGSLKDIEMRWGDGRGPLAKQFRVEELRNLIKALFQNTQFRANLLSKIK